MSETETTAVEQIAGLECPECGRCDEMGYGEAEAERILGGDEHGFVRCPECGQELEPTVEEALAMLDLIARRRAKEGEKRE